MNSLLILFGVVCLCTVSSYAFPNIRNPKLEYEMITGATDETKSTWSQEDAALMPLTTKRPIITVVTTPMIVDANSKTFVYDSKTKSWSLMPANALPPSDTNALLWNQSNDKWLTQAALP